MRLSILPILLTGASAVSFVVAEPIRVIENPSAASANIRFGHSLANANVNGNDDNVARIIRPTVIMNITPQSNNKGLFRHLCGASLREKALRMSNAFRQALGMPLIETDQAAPGPGEFHVLPLPYAPPNAIFHSQEESDREGRVGKHHEHKHPNHPDDGEEHEHHRHHRHHGHHGHHRHQHGHHQKSFLRRFCRAIKSLGPWEGRAVAFVLGCGIGVLLRMFWVLTVLAYRTVRGEREETLDHEYFIYEPLPGIPETPEALFEAPPEYEEGKIDVEARKQVEEHK